MYRSWFIACFLSFCLMGAIAQSPWERIDLAGSEAKVISFNPRYFIGVHGHFPLNRPDAIQQDGPALQQELTDPEVFEKLFESLGGEFFVGEFTGPSTQVFSLEGRLQPMPGLTACFRMGKRMEIQTGLSLFRANWSGSFPYTVNPSDGQPPFTDQGHLTATSEGLIADLALAAYFSESSFRPFVRAGVRGQFVVDQRGYARLGSTSISRTISPVDQTIQPFGGVGCRFVPVNGFAIDIGANFSRLPGMNWKPSLLVGGGLLF
ncbi:MAG: hypothetical protein K9I85_03240 [Saprospiraceae bacterium]|nr:hypothetical protein [Saprospiraceae bacterium]